MKFANSKFFSKDIGSNVNIIRKSIFSARCKYIYIYSLHLALTAEDLLSMICVFENKVVSLNRR